MPRKMLNCSALARKRVKLPATASGLGGNLA
jgi:hypothetical protein